MEKGSPNEPEGQPAKDVQKIIGDHFNDQDPRVRTAAIKSMVGVDGAQCGFSIFSAWEGLTWSACVRYDGRNFCMKIPSPEVAADSSWAVSGSPVTYFLARKAKERSGIVCVSASPWCKKCGISPKLQKYGWERHPLGERFVFLMQRGAIPSNLGLIEEEELGIL